MTIIVTTTGSSAARDYDWLKASVASWMHRTDLGAIIPDFVMLAEKRINGDLEARLQDATTTINTIASQVTVEIPSDVSEIKSINVPLHGPLDYLTPDQFNSQFSRARSGVPRFFTVIGSLIHLGPTPDAVYALQCAYRAFVPPLSDAAGGINWLIRDYPNVYLAAAMCEAFGYTKKFTELPAWEAKYADAVGSVNKTDWFSGSSMRVRSDVRL